MGPRGNLQISGGIGQWPPHWQRETLPKLHSAEETIAPRYHRQARPAANVCVAQRARPSASCDAPHTAGGGAERRGQGDQPGDTGVGSRLVMSVTRMFVGGLRLPLVHAASEPSRRCTKVATNVHRCQSARSGRAGQCLASQGNSARQMGRQHKVNLVLRHASLSHSSGSITGCEWPSASCSRWA